MTDNHHKQKLFEVLNNYEFKGVVKLKCLRTVDQEQPLKSENKGIFNKLTVEIKWSTKNTNLIQKKVGKEKKTKPRPDGPIWKEIGKG